MSTLADDLPPPPPPPRRRARWGLRLLVALLVLAALVCAAAWWLLGTGGGAQLILEQVRSVAGEGAKIEGVEGRVFGGLRVKNIEVDRPDLYIRLQDVDLDAAPPLAGRMEVRALKVRSIEVRTASTGEAAKIPVSFKPPYPVSVESLHVEELRFGELVRGAPRDANRARDVVVRNLRLKGSGDKSRWNIEEASAETPYGRARLAGTLETTSPFALQARGELAGRYGERDYNVALVARGDLQAFEANLEGRLGSTPAKATLQVEPFGTVPVKSLVAEVKGLDVHEFVPGAPVTKLDIEAKLASTGKSFAGPVRFTNAEPGTIDRQRLPVTSAAARVVVAVGTGRVEVSDAVLALAGGGGASGRAVIEKGRVEATLKVENTNLAALHTQLQPTRLAGQVAVVSTAGGQRFEGQLRDPRFAVEGRGSATAELVTLDAVRVAHKGGAIEGRGTLGLKGARAFRLEGKAEHFDPATFAKVAAGDLNFTFVASGTMSPALAGEAKVDFGPSRYAGLPAGGRAHVAGDRHRIARADVEVTLGDARLTALGSFGRAGDAMDVKFAAPNLAVLAKPLGVAVAGRLEGEGRLTGTFAVPAGRVSLKGANLALPANVYVREVALKAEAGADPASRIEGNLQASGVAIGDAKPPTPLAETLAATLSGTRAAHRFTLDAAMTKEQRVTAALEGGLDPKAKALSWSGQVQSLALTGPSAFALVAPASLAFGPQRAELGDARLKGEWGEARLAVTRWTPQLLELRGSSPGLAIRDTARALRLPPVRRGSDLVVAADWDIRAGESFDGTASLRRVSGDLRLGEPAVRLGLEEVLVKLDAVRGRARAVVDVRAERIGRIQGEGTALLVRGRAGWEFS
jgi:translocation and assembly module TamB